MIVHVVLYRPRTDIGDARRAALIDALNQAPERMPWIRRLLVGRRLDNPPAYQMTGFPDFPFAAIVEFDTRADLERYLADPAHQDLGRLFNETADLALIYDFEVREARDARELASLA